MIAKHLSHVGLQISADNFQVLLQAALRLTVVIVQRRPQTYFLGIAVTEQTVATSCTSSVLSSVATFAAGLNFPVE